MLRNFTWLFKYFVKLIRLKVTNFSVDEEMPYKGVRYENGCHSQEKLDFEWSLKPLTTFIRYLGIPLYFELVWHNRIDITNE